LFSQPLEARRHFFRWLDDQATVLDFSFEGSITAAQLKMMLITM
jgi:hypothetical protein